MGRAVSASKRRRDFILRIVCSAFVLLCGSTMWQSCGKAKFRSGTRLTQSQDLSEHRTFRYEAIAAEDLQRWLPKFGSPFSAPMDPSERWFATWVRAARFESSPDTIHTNWQIVMESENNE